MFKIGDFSKLSQVSIRMLRYYDQMGLLSPAQIDPFTGYRMYSAKQLPKLQKIVALRDMGFGVSEISELLQNWKADFVAQKLEARQTQIDLLIKEEKIKQQKLQSAKLDIHTFIQDADYKIEEDNFVTIKSIPSFPILSLRKRLKNYFCESDLWAEFGSIIETNNIPIPKKAQTITYFHDDDFRDENVDVEVATQVDRIGKNIGALTYRESEAVETMACILVKGPFTNIDPAYKKFATWLEEQGIFEMAGPSRQICHIGPWNTKKEENFLVELQTPIEKIKKQS